MDGCCLDQPAHKLVPWMVAACAPKAHSGLGGLAGDVMIYQGSKHELLCLCEWLDPQMLQIG